MSNDPAARPKSAIVERPPCGAAEAAPSESALDARIRQQRILSELGVSALKGTSLGELLNAAVRLAADGLRADFAKVLEYIPSENRLLMKAGVGWDPELIGRATVGADLESPSGFALRTGKPVISNHLENEQRFRTPDLLAQHGVRRAINVILQGDGAPYGILEVDSRSEGEFTEDDIAFLQGAANIVGMAIERQRRELKLAAALEHQQVLVKEINHRVKNSLQLVSSMLRLQAGGEPTVAAHLTAAASRIAAIARAHDRLYRSPQVDRIDLKAYLQDLCSDLTEVAPHCELVCEASDTILMSTDQAIRVALIVTELVTNAAKHAYPHEQGERGRIWITLSRTGDGTGCISVRDEGLGLPVDFEAKHGGLGMRLVRALTEQTEAALSVRRCTRGTEFAIALKVE